MLPVLGLNKHFVTYKMCKKDQNHNSINNANIKYGYHKKMKQFRREMINKMDVK